MPSFKPVVVLFENLDTIPKVAGQVIFTKDPAELYIDFSNDNRVKMSGGGGSGEKGDPGKSAFELAQDEGFTGSLDDWLASLIGDHGEPGPKGNDGTTFTPEVDENGNLSWSNEDGKENPETVNIKGPKGEDGEPGPIGSIATQLSQLYILNKELWIDNVQTVEIDLDVNNLNDVIMSLGEREIWTECGVAPIAESNVGITFKCDTVPDEDLSFKIATFSNGGSGGGGMSVAPNAGAHNAVYRGQYLGDTVTPAQYAAIKAGTFDDLFIGDYWTIDGINWRIAHFDYYLNSGDTMANKVQEHHIVIVPDTCLGNCQYRNTASGNYENNSSVNVSTYGYTNSDLYKGKLYDDVTDNNFTIAKNRIKTIFGDHILNHRAYLISAAANGYPSAGDWKDSEIDLMNEYMVCGTGISAPNTNGTTIPVLYTNEKSQLCLFRYRYDLIISNNSYWLRNIAVSWGYSLINLNGCFDYFGASVPYGIRPSFCIYGGPDE